MDEEDVSTNEHDSYYAVLGVSRDASLEDVRRSYRQLAQVCHPDKISDPTAREQAAEDFTRIQQAYEVPHQTLRHRAAMCRLALQVAELIMTCFLQVLGNDEKRVIYDLYGKEGLEAGLELAEVPRNTDELRREYERNRAKQAISLQSEVHHLDTERDASDFVRTVNSYCRQRSGRKSVWHIEGHTYSGWTPVT